MTDDKEEIASSHAKDNDELFLAQKVKRHLLIVEEGEGAPELWS